MKKFTVLLLAVVGIFMLTNSAQALTFSLSEPLVEDGSTLKPCPDYSCDDAPWLTAVFEDVTDTTTGQTWVELTLYAYLQDDNFVTEWDFNVADAYLSGLKFEVKPGSVNGIDPTPAPSIGKDDYKADGTGGYFDIEFLFPNSGNDDRFDGTDSITYKITSNVTGFNAAAFNLESVEKNPDGSVTKTGWHTAAHIQEISLDPPGSTWIGDGKIDNPVPEPGTILLLGAGLLGLLGFGRKLKK